MTRPQTPDQQDSSKPSYAAPAENDKYTPDQQLAALNAIIDELKKQDAHYNLKGGHLLLYERDGVNVYLGDRLAELEAQKAKLKGETDA